MADKTVVVRIVVRANQFSSGLKKVASDTQKLAGDVEQASKKAGSSALALGTASATAGKLMLVGIGGSLAVSAKAAIDFESSLAGVAKTTDLTGSAFARAGSPVAAFGEALRTLSMRIPLNVNDLARIAEIGGQLGIQVPHLIDFTETMAALAVSTNLSAEEAATGMARFANIMGTAQDQFGRLGSVIVDLGNKLPSTESEILHFGTRLAPIGKTVGLVENEVLGLSAAMTSLGIPAERGGTALQRLFLDMQTAVLGGGEALEKWASATRMTTDEFKALFRESPAKVFIELVKQLDRTTRSGGNAAGVLQDIGVIQQRSIQVLLAAASGWETVASSIDIANQANEDGNALFVEAARRYGTSASQIQLLSNAFNDLRIEIGNALLGSGGLAAGLDFLREFIRIIKDNLPMVARLASTLAAVAAIRIGAGMIQGLAEGFKKLAAARAGVDGMTRGVAALKLGMLGVNTAVFGAIAIASILITRWAMAAAKAAELRHQTRLLQDAINEGADPIEAMIANFKESGILTEERIDALNRLGISEEEFIRRMLRAEVSLKDFSDDARGSAEMLDQMAKLLGVNRTELARMNWISIRTGHEFFETLRDTVVETGDQIGSFVGTRSDEFRNAFIEAGLGVRFTREELQRMADFVARTQPFDVDPEMVARKIAGFEGFPELSIAAEQFATSQEQTSSRVRLSWQEMVNGVEGGADLMKDFFDSMFESGTDFRDTLAESFKEVADSIRGSFPAWDEYEQISIKNINAVIEAQDKYLEDLRDGLELQSELVGQVSSNVLGYIESLDPATKGALARWRRTNEGEFNAWIAEIGANLDEVDVLTSEYFNLKLPGAMQEGFAKMFNAALASAQSFNLPGEQTADALMAGLGLQLSSLTATEQQEYLGYIRDLFTDKETLQGYGLEMGDPLVIGMIKALSTLAIRAQHELDRQASKLTQRWNDRWGIRSPSKVTMKIGEQVTKGFFVGMEEEFEHQMRVTNMPIINVNQKQPIVNVTTKSQSGSRDLHIYYPQHKEDDIVDAVQKNSLINNLVREAETTVGFG